MSDTDFAAFARQRKTLAALTEQQKREARRPD